MTSFDVQIYRPRLIFQYLAKQRKNVEQLVVMKKFRYFLELRVVKTTTTTKKIEFFTTHKNNNNKKNKKITH